MRPNIFRIATSELSQDAFLAWFMQWAEPQNKAEDADLCARAQDFVRLLIGKAFPGQPPEINKVEVGRKARYQNIDVWAEINDEFLIIVEDKTHTGPSGNQLERYRQLGEELWTKPNPGRKLICIWLKTGADSKQSIENVRKAGFCPVERDELRLFFKQVNLVNNIFSDFTENFDALLEAEQSFATHRICDWTWNSWEGFYQFLDSRIAVDGWGYVPNPGGGFLGLWWHFKTWKNNTWENNTWENNSVYLQITQDDLCLKIAVEEHAIQSRLRQEWFERVMERAAAQGRSEIIQPNRFGKGTYMTVAKVRRQDWLGADDKVLDPEAVIERLRGYERFLDSCLS